MATLNEVTSTTVWIRTILYLLGRVGRERTTRHLVEALRPSIEALDRAAERVEAAERSGIDARAALDAADNDLDEQIAMLEATLLLAVGRNRKDARYRKVFPEGLSGATRTNAQDQVRRTRRIEEVLERDFTEDPAVAPLLGRIRAAREELERQVVLYQSALDDINAARAAERRTRIDVADAYRITYAELVKIFPQNLRKVRSFFRHGRAGGAADEPPLPEPSPAPEPPVVDPATPS